MEAPSPRHCCPRQAQPARWTSCRPQLLVEAPLTARWLLRVTPRSAVAESGCTSQLNLAQSGLVQQLQQLQQLQQQWGGQQLCSAALKVK